MSDTLKTGDVVQLKSGGPLMTVEWVGESSMTGTVVASCQWFDEKNKVFNQAFPPASLCKVEEEA